MISQPLFIEISQLIFAGHLPQRIHKVAFFMLVGLIEQSPRIIAGRHETVIQRLQKEPMNPFQSLQRFPEGVYARLESLEEHDANQAAEVYSRTMKVAVWLDLLLVRLQVIPEAVACICELLTWFWRISLACRPPEICPESIVEPLVGVFDAVPQGPPARVAENTDGAPLQ